MIKTRMLKSVEKKLRESGYILSRDGWARIGLEADRRFLRYAVIKGENVLVTVAGTTGAWHVETLRSLECFVVYKEKSKRDSRAKDSGQNQVQLGG